MLMLLLTYLVGFDQSEIIMSKKLKKLGNLRVNIVRLGSKVVYLIYSSGRLYMVLCIYDHMVGYSPVNLMVNLLFV